MKEANPNGMRPHANEPDEPRVLGVPGPGLVVLCGPTASGKSSFAARCFEEQEVVSLASCRSLLGEDGPTGRTDEAALGVFHAIVDARLQLGRWVVADACSLDSSERLSLLQAARRNQLPATLIVFDADLEACAERARAMGRLETPADLEAQGRALRTCAPLEERGAWAVRYRLREEDIATAGVDRRRLPQDRRHLKGPFDVIGDIHGCHAELVSLLELLGYCQESRWSHPDGRKAIFLGDLVDRGPASVKVLKLVLGMAEAGHAFVVPGNHEMALLGWIEGGRVSQGYGMESTVAEFEALPQAEADELRGRITPFLRSLSPYLLLDDGDLLVVHAGLPERWHGRNGPLVRAHCFNGTSSVSRGARSRQAWAREYEGRALVIYGHTPVAQSVMRNNTINLDQGCVFGGNLAAFRYPERSLVTVPAQCNWYLGRAGVGALNPGRSK